MNDIDKTKEQLINELAELRRENAELQQSIAKVRDSESMLQKAVEAAQIGIWKLDPVTYEVVWSDELYQIFGLSPADIHDSLLEAGIMAIHPDDREMARMVSLSSIEAKQPYQIEYRVLHPDGTVRHTITKGEAICDEKGEILEVIGTVQDVTERKQAEESLRNSEERFALAMKFANDGLYDWNLETSEIYYSPVWKSLLGYADDEIKNDFSEWERLTKPEDVQTSWVMLNELLAGKRERFENDFQMRHKDGHWVDILSRANATHNREGKPVRIVGTHVDITERKKLEAQLRQSQKMEAMGTLAGGIAHEFNNILAIMQGYGHILLKKLPEDSVEKSYVESIYEAGKRATHLTKQILTFSRMESQKYNVHYIQPLVKETLKMIRATLPVTIDIQQDIDPDCPPILADLSQLHQVLINLYTNAFHAMEGKGGVLKVSLQEEKYDDNKSTLSKLIENSYLKMTVSDTGCGISLDDQEKIFDPFFTTKEVGKGTGLGLSVVHSIIEQHGGVITLESVPNQGTTFYIYIPAAQDKTNEEEPKEVMLSKGEGHILVIDDEAAITGLFKDMLADIGYEVTVFNNEVEALEVFQETPNRFDLILIDHVMPHLTGDLVSLQMLKIRPNLPIILTTGYSADISEEKINSLGIQEFFMKPIEAEKLVQTIQKLLGKENQGTFNSRS